LYRLRINTFLVIFAILSVSCGFVDLRPIEVRTNPGALDTVLPETYSPVSVWFNTEMVRREAENLLQVGSDSGLVEGDRRWEGNTLAFVPAAGWNAGTRYVLGLSGMARSADGREIRLDRNVSFFAVNRSGPPLVEWHYPADGESVSANGLRMEIHFSRMMDRIAVESALTVEGMGDKKYQWLDDDRTLAIIPEKSLSPWTVYRWALKTSAKSADGVPLPKTFSAVFCTDLDRLMPEVSRVYPVLESEGRWISTGGSLEDDLGPALGIAVEFNKPMAEAAFRSLRFEPSLAGRTEKLSDTGMVFIPSRDPDPEVVYTLIISGDARDAEGLKIGSDYRRVFTADIPYLRVLSVNADGISMNPESGAILPVVVSEADGGLVRFTIHFSLPFSDEAKQKTALAITLIPFFPASLDPIALRFVSWLSDDRLGMEWERLGAGTSAGGHYYRLAIPGGRGGIASGGGMYLQEDIVVYLEAVE
jgi:hypothetical protein